MGTIEKTNVLLDADDITFATTASSGENDVEFFEWMKDEYKDIFSPDQFQVLNIVEKAWALIAVSKEVITDRYHPGIAAHILGKKITIVNYENEMTKMQGLAD